MGNVTFIFLFCWQRC